MWVSNDPSYLPATEKLPIEEVLKTTYVCSVPFFTSNLEASWTALFHLTDKKGWKFMITSQDKYDNGPLYFCDINCRDFKYKWVQGDSRFGDMEDSLPLAICRACLLTVFELEGEFE